ncbi:MAG: sugar ABC transporter ATP-binding protein [Rhizobiaceae bacterium]|nr:sugar ABC transporter ATP-binding protein [Rhizobiaceae bacterium]
MLEAQAAASSPTRQPIVSARGIGKSFGATRAVDGVDLDLFAGEVHGIMGENGAGKSTLMRILAGSFPDYDGSITVGDRDVEITNPAAARHHGLALVHQELSLLPELSVAENIFLGREPAGPLPWTVSFQAMTRAARAVLRECEIAIDPSTRVDDLGIAERQLVEIVKGVAASPRVLILDEPTSSLTVSEVRDLFAIISRLTARGTAIVYISHKLDEMFAVTNRITVLRDGRMVASAPTEEWNEASLVRAMVGRDLSALFPHTAATPGPVRLEVRDLRRHGVFGPVSLTLREGEIVGLYGIIGAGRSELAEAIYGLAPADDGQILRDGMPVTIRSASRALAAGIAMSPEDRHARGLVPMLTIGTNLSLSSLGALSRAGFVDRAAERRRIDEYVKRLLIRAKSPAQEVSALSGGNQQKVVLGRTLMPGPRILILDEPTRGIDVVAKAEVHGTIDRLAHEGLAVLLISSELPEILGMSDRILVMRDGRLVGEVARSEATEERLVAMAAGANHGE